MVQFFILFLIFFVPGFIGVLAYNLVSGFKIKKGWKSMMAGMIFNLISSIIMLFGLWLFKHIFTIGDLINYFTCLHFTIMFAIVIIIVNIGLGIFFGIIRRLF